MTTTTEFCPTCGVAIDEPSPFCGNCGTALADPEPSPAAAGPPPAESVSETHGRSQRTPGTAAATSRSAQGGAARPPVGGAPPGEPSPPGEHPPKKPRAWVPFVAIGGAAIVVAGLVVVLLVALSSSAGSNVKSSAVTRAQALALLAANGTTTVSSAAPGLFAVVTAGKLTTIVPAGWRATAQAATGTTRAEFADPRHPGTTLTIVEEAGRGGNDHDRAGAAERAVRRRGYAVSGYGPTSFPGGREVWHLIYADGTTTHETYFYSACRRGAAAMVVDIASLTTSFQSQRAPLETAASAAEPLC